MGSMERRVIHDLRKQATAKPWLQIGLLVLGVALIVGFIIDISTIRRRQEDGYVVDVATDIQTVVLGLEGDRIEDPRGFFTVVPPAGWVVSLYPESDPYNVSFHGPHGVDIKVMAKGVEYDDFNALLRRLEGIEREIGMNTHIEPTTFQGHPAARRTSRLHEAKVFSIDFVADRVSHHLLCRIPHELFEKYEPLCLDVLNTYQPLPRGGPTAVP